MANLEDNEFTQMKSEHQQRIEKFMELAGQKLPTKPTLPNLETRKLRAKLILEEALETVDALGLYAETDREAIDLRIDDIIFKELAEPNLIGIVDGCCDLSVVTIGTLSACGVPDIPVLQLTDENNLAKFGPGGYRREDGKWIKPPNHKPPDYSKVLNG